MAIETREDLQEHLQWAMQVELSTIPTYLYAMYSIEDEHSDPYKLVRSIVVEEMLHTALVANLNVAIGGQPAFYDEAVMPSYPMDLPHHKPPLRLNLQPCSIEFIEGVCMPIEHPRPVDGLPEDDDYETIEQFYLAVEHAIESLDQREPLFETPRVARQMMDPSYYAPVEFDVEESGGLRPVTDLESACLAVETVIHQGEGLRDEHWADPGHHELTHYYKFKQIADGTYPLGTVRPVPTNPTRDDFDPALRPVAELFDAVYSYTFVLMDEIYSTTDREEKDALVANLYVLMSGVLGRIARYLTSRPAADDTDVRAAPTFEFYRFEEPSKAATEIRELAAAVASNHEELAIIETLVKRL
ncbi:ferritin-like domain-containing protein [Haloferax sp. YSSS75]|uniref:ferritin-like domain-containing protein n=1 Tax=Haloferax sp. YSSS75 TaxID=3388564 RepID=UPI00398D1B9B